MIIYGLVVKILYLIRGKILVDEITCENVRDEKLVMQLFFAIFG